MELLITIAYAFLVRLVFFDYKLIKFNLFWKFIVFGIWIAAAMTEIVFLGQYAPYSKQAFVQAYVVQLAPEFGGKVTEVFAQPNVPVKKGDPLVQMDPAPWQYRVDEQLAKLSGADTSVATLEQSVQQAAANLARVEANLGLARVTVKQVSDAAAQNAASVLRVEQVQKEVVGLEAEAQGARAALRSTQLALASQAGKQPTAVAQVMASLESARYNLEQTTIRAPSDGFVANLQLYPGAFVRLKTPIMTFVSSEKHWVVAKALQQGMQHVAVGDPAEVAFDMYPGVVFAGEVESVTWASGNAQGQPVGRIPTEQEVRVPHEFVVRVRVIDEDPRYPIRFGATAIVAVYSKACPDFLKLLRQIEIQSESYLKYLFNPF